MSDVEDDVVAVVVDYHADEFLIECVDSLFAAGSRLAYEPSDHRRGHASVLGAFPILRTKCPGDPTRDLFSLPLQI